MQTNKSSTKQARKGPVLVTLAVAVALAASFSLGAQAQGGGSTAEIEVEFHEDDMGFDVASSKGISNVIVELCPPAGAHKHEGFGEEQKNWTHEENVTIVAIWVKSGNNHDPEGPAPPAPFNNPGAGEHFANEGVVCEPTNGEPVCVGPTNVSATALEDGTILVDWDGVDGEDGYNVYRKTGGENFTFLAHVDAPDTDYLDNSTVVGTTYTYIVTATLGETESDSCEEASATAIPVFPTLVAASMAVLASVGAYGFLRRRD